MFIHNVKPRKRGRPRGETSQGAATKAHLYDTAITLIAERGFAATTLREVAHRAGVSVGLLYRYFPSKQAVVIALYDDLSAEYAKAAAGMPTGKWRHRFVFALTTSLRVLAPHRATLAALVPVLVGDPEDGLFAPMTSFSRLRVQQVFQDAITGASDTPSGALAEALGRLLYLVHLGVILCWLLDRSPRQRASTGLVSLLQHMLPSAAVALRLPLIRGFVRTADGAFREALLDPAGGR